MKKIFLTLIVVLSIIAFINCDGSGGGPTSPGTTVDITNTEPIEGSGITCTDSNGDPITEIELPYIYNETVYNGTSSVLNASGVDVNSIGKVSIHISKQVDNLNNIVIYEVDETNKKLINPKSAAGIELNKSSSVAGYYRQSFYVDGAWTAGKVYMITGFLIDEDGVPATFTPTMVK